MTDIVKYIKKKTKGMNPSTRFMWVEKNIYNPFRIESIKYVNGELIHIPDDADSVGEAIMQKDANKNKN